MCVCIAGGAQALVLGDLVAGASGVWSATEAGQDLLDSLVVSVRLDA